MLFYVVAYDIPDDQRRQKIAAVLLGYGKRVQYSVFECVLSESKYREMTTRLKKLFKENEDSFRIYPITKHTLAQVITWGVDSPPLTQPPRSIIV